MNRKMGNHTTSIIVGIDLGTTNSVVSYLGADKNPVTLEVDGSKLLPSVVSLTENGFIVGQTAKNMLILEPSKTVASVKRKIGQDITLPIGDKQLRPEEISALVLKKIKQTVCRHFGLKESESLRAVVTVPAYFTEEQRDATKQAAELAGLKLERIINEPTSAALAFGLSQMDEAVYAIYDFGGGTFDVSVIESNAGLVEVLATTGNNHLGGDDLDEMLSKWIWNAFLEKNKLPYNTVCTANEKARLTSIAERTKIRLSSEPSVEIQESFFAHIKGISYHLETTVDRSVFENLILTKVQETIEHLEKAVKDANLTFEDLDGIILVGGSSRIPLISKMIEEQLGIVPVLIDLPDEAVAHGAAIQGAIIDGLDIDTILVDITPHSLGVAAADQGMFMEMISLNQMDLDPNEIGDKFLRASPIIAKNTPVPTKRSEQYSSFVPFQKKYELKVYQGEQHMFKDNRQIGETFLEVANPVEHGLVDITFALDINGLLEVTAAEATTGERVQVTFKSSRGKKMRESKANELQIVQVTKDTDHTLLTRSEVLIAENRLNGEDKAELQTLSDKFRQALAENTSNIATIETELLDLLYFLENN
jgi:molecular chaperone DnaK